MKYMLDFGVEEHKKLELKCLITKQLDSKDPTPMNIYELKNCIYYGFSDDYLRPKYWKILLNYYSPNIYCSETYYSKARKAYIQILKDADMENEQNKKLIAIIRSEIQRCNKLFAYLDGEVEKECIERIIFSFCIINSKIGYVQGMINLAHIFYKVLKEYSSVEDAKFAEEDAFYLFNNLISESAPLFIEECDNLKNGLLSKIDEVYEIIKIKDPLLHSVMVGKELDRALFPTRWILLLFSSEYDFEDTIWLWDKIFCDSYRFELLSYFCATIIILMKDVIMQESFEKCLVMLQKPYVISPKIVFEIADVLRREDSNIEKLLKKKLQRDLPDKKHGDDI